MLKSKPDPIVIVSGLPRCGTSMMMQMLDAGGMPVVIDHIREANEDNPRGYYEFEQVKKIKEDASWLEGCYGKAFKMVSALLLYLPKNKHYKVIFMKRKMAEMIASQNVMLERQGIKDDNISDKAVARKLEKHLNKVEGWLGDQKNIDVIYISFNETIQNPRNSAEIVSEFLDGRVDVDKMAGSVDKTLHRQKQ